MVIGISGSLIWSKTLMELIFNPCGEFRLNPEGPVSQILSPCLHVGAPGIIYLLTSIQILKRESGVRKASGSYRTYSSLVKLQPWVPALAVKDLPLIRTLMMIKLQAYKCPVLSFRKYGHVNKVPYISADKTIAESYKKAPKIRGRLIRQIQKKLD